jgi:hypothetical protein
LQEEGAGFAKTRQWCSSIGADGAVEYLDAVARLFPGGRIPTDIARRSAVVRRLNMREEGDPLVELDKEYRGAMRELVSALRKYVRTNLPALEGAAAAPPTIAVESVDAMLKRALGSLEEAKERLHEKARALHRAAQERGLRELDGKPDPRMTAFFEALKGLSKSEWLDIVQRGIDRRRQLQVAQLEIARVTSYLRIGVAMSKEEFDERVRRPALALRDTFFEEVIDRLPKKSRAGSETIELREEVRSLMVQVSLLFMVYDWVRATPEGRRAGENLLSVFEPFVRLPVL